jgi:Na+/phosphate symporter
MRLTPFYIAFIYFIFSALWILLSDNLLHELQQHQGIDDIMPLAVAKGLFFITATAVIIFFSFQLPRKKTAKFTRKLSKTI